KRVPDQTDTSPRTLICNRSKVAPRAQGPPWSGRSVQRQTEPSNADHTGDNEHTVGSVRHYGHAQQWSRSGRPSALDATPRRLRSPRLSWFADWAIALATDQATDQSECGGRRAVSATGCLHGPRITR